MPVTRSELLFLCGGALAGAVVAKNYDKIKAKTGPLLAAAGAAVGDAYTAAARRVGERVEAMQDATARPYAAQCLGRIGPVNCGLVTITWPNRSSSPGPLRLAFGSVAPTCAVCPAAETVCNGVTRNASQMAPTVTTRKAST